MSISCSFLHLFIPTLPFSSMSFSLIHYRSGITLWFPSVPISPGLTVPSPSKYQFEGDQSLKQSSGASFWRVVPPKTLEARRHFSPPSMWQLAALASSPSLSGEDNIVTRRKVIEGASFIFDLSSKRRWNHGRSHARGGTKGALNAAGRRGSLIDANVISEVEDTKWNYREMSQSHVWCRHLFSFINHCYYNLGQVDHCSCCRVIINITECRFYKGIKRLLWQNRSHFTSAHGKWMDIFRSHLSSFCSFCHSIRDKWSSFFLSFFFLSNVIPL